VLTDEEMLELRFGNAYTEYQRKTGRFLPRP
jgi:protein-S-isoprenylcysteine O-methyltransferase Ste14